MYIYIYVYIYIYICVYKSMCFIGLCIESLILFLKIACLADSEMRTHDGASQDDVSEQNRSWDDSGTIISET